MVLGLEVLNALINDPEVKLVENLSDYRQEGAGLDLRVGEIYRLKADSEGFLGITTRSTPEIQETIKYQESNSQIIDIRPGEYLLMRTVEWVNLPEDLVGIFVPRTTLFRSGLILLTAQAAPGYHGQLVFGLFNAGPARFQLELGARVAHMMLFRIEGRTALYKGTWQGGRVRTDPEKQI